MVSGILIVWNAGTLPSILRARGTRWTVSGLCARSMGWKSKQKTDTMFVLHSSKYNSYRRKERIGAPFGAIVRLREL